MTASLARDLPQRALDMAGLGGLAFLGDPPDIVGRDPVLRFPRPIGEAAATAIALCGDAAAEIWRRRTRQRQRPSVAVREAAAALAGYAYLLLDPNEGARPADWEPEPGGWRAWGARSLLRGENASNAAVGIYRTRDGRWIHVHGGLPHLATRIMEVLGTDASGIPAAVADWDAKPLEDALAEAGTCAAVVRSAEEWRRHPQGRAIAGHPVVEVIRIGDAPPEPLPPGDRPLSGLRALDLSLALAGPICARTLAEHGADVLQVIAPGRLDRQPFELETGHGKRSTMLDLKRENGRARLEALARAADVFCQGYRKGALAKLGFDADRLAALRPGIVYVSINCYGHTGPWSRRRGWEGLGQAATGLTVPRMDGRPPRLAPCSVCDYLTGYLAARGVMEALLRRAEEGGSWHVRASLCQTGTWITRMGTVDEETAPAAPDLFDDLLVARETDLGRLRHLPPALQMEVTPPRWDGPPPTPGSSNPIW
ncbi:CoA transferase [Roseitranquillus sediminis]|uniref:CoA transferase n=1 Tax=Roseitranquillus sediminis TaxID=2809051 RepID=UPI001D0C4C4A|nr:CoA transferase [Roseitranquillus sediminis]MBM9594476.1 CoA transferase [Roseitranquillus sediminis]